MLFKGAPISTSTPTTASRSGWISSSDVSLGSSNCVKGSSISLTPCPQLASLVMLKPSCFISLVAFTSTVTSSWVASCRLLSARMPRFS